MDTSDPFGKVPLNRIFATSVKFPDRLTSRENSWLEFKEAFGFKSLGRYIRSAAAFANVKGGYIVYGVANSPHRMVGLRDKSFDQLDPERLTQFLNEHFDPEIEWGRHLYELNGKTFGLLYFAESRNKPVICKKGTDDGKLLREGEIYYRYNGRSQTVRYAELKELMDERRKQEQRLWFKHFKEIARVGIQDVGIFNLKSGGVSAAGGRLLIDPSLLSQIAFIREGRLTERKGAPTLRVTGEAQVIGGSAAAGDKLRIIKTKGIRASDIILGFLRSEKILEPQAYLTQVCYESSAFLPFYYLLKQAGLSLTETENLIRNEPSTQPAKSKLLQRLNDDANLRLAVPKPHTSSGQRKLQVRSTLLKREVPSNLDERCLRDVLSVLRTLSKKEIDPSYINPLLERLFNKYYARGDSAINSEFRRAVSYLDFALNRVEDT